jgi:hypothetical protein
VSFLPSSPLITETRVFVSPERLGNPVRIVMAASAAAVNAAVPGARHQWPFALCLAWLRDDAGRHRIAVTCEQAGQPIQICGHGLLAVAQLAFGISQRPLELVSGTYCFQVLPPDPGGSTVWLQTERPAWQSVADSGEAAWFSPQPEHVAVITSGPEDGYRLIVLPPGVPLDSIRVDLTAIARYDRRALLLTQRATGAEQLRCDYRLRYFAPQYGNPEDAATGSAHWLAAAWWSEQLHRAELRSEQCPPTGDGWQPGPRPGGVIHTRTSDRCVALSGELSPFCRL